MKYSVRDAWASVASSLMGSCLPIKIGVIVKCALMQNHHENDLRSMVEVKKKNIMFLLLLRSTTMERRLTLFIMSLFAETILLDI